VVAGLEEATGLFEGHGLKVGSDFKDGDEVKRGDEVLRIEGKARAILEVERTALNFIMRMSGIATETSKLVGICRKVTRRGRWKSGVAGRTGATSPISY
jgi:nicotinate-nucleotide pyrophosphorylase (carboxylating)